MISGKLGLATLLQKNKSDSPHFSTEDDVSVVDFE